MLHPIGSANNIDMNGRLSYYGKTTVPRGFCKNIHDASYPYDGKPVVRSTISGRNTLLVNAII